MRQSLLGHDPHGVLGGGEVAGRGVADDERVKDGLVEGHLALLHVLQDRRGARHVAHLAEPGRGASLAPVRGDD